MAYIDPNQVLSPKATWTLKHVTYNGGPGGWSAAEGQWNGTPCLAVRWNGSDNDDGVGSPQSRGYPTWFIVPDELEAVTREAVKGLRDAPAVSCRIERPEGYMIGAWRMTATLRPDMVQRLGNNRLMFDLPDLPGRRCNPDRDYISAFDGQLHGCFVEGKWLGDLYSNGVHEDQNPTSVEVFQEAFIKNVMAALERAGLAAR
ncbi:hypothetical protein [Burkholderia vietnamiensis]|uniref:hypothetical protein n=1 Tax=Burkholderia vietnamiensis TaxID=60552 RepID=UPI00264F4137|nr:hypothetical protein [Burkholderia vietnamiensis]MDN7820899.1 hypothetical protein [Burkholderia vietnamiensis]